MACLRILWIVCVVFICATHSATSTRETSERVSDDKSSVYDEGKHGSRDEYNRRVQDPDKHISERLVRYFRFGGILQAISEETNIPRAELVTGGASRFQDQSSGLGPSVHAAHIIRVGAINSKLKNKSPSLNRALQNYIGHTQNVLRAANAWHGIGGDIDKYQSNNLNILATIDFNGRYNDNEATIETLQSAFRKIVDDYVLKNKRDETALQIDKETVYMVSLRMLFDSGFEGYEMVQSGKFVEQYTKTINEE